MAVIENVRTGAEGGAARWAAMPAASAGTAGSAAPRGAARADEVPTGDRPDSRGADAPAGAITADLPPVSPEERARRRAQFEREALQHLDAMYSFALKLARARDDAEDLVSDTLLRAFERWEQYRLGTNIRAWLFTILYHVFVSRKRRVDAREVPQHEDADGWTPHEPVGEADPEGRFYDSFLDEEITRAIDALPEEYRTAVVLSDVQGLRYAEIADVLRIPEGTVKSRLFRGRRILQKKLAGYAVEMGYLKLASNAA